MEWKSLEIGSVIAEPEDKPQEESKGFYCAADSPGCSNRGKYRKEVRACWDTMKHLTYIDENLTDGKGTIFDILRCSSCFDYYLEESFETIERDFICFECNRKDE